MATNRSARPVQVRATDSLDSLVPAAAAGIAPPANPGDCYTSMVRNVAPWLPPG